MTDWKRRPQNDIEAAIKELKTSLPGWWYSICECQVSCDATIAPTTESPDIGLIETAGDRFDAGFDVALPQPSTLAEALRHVTKEALSAKASNPLG